MFRLKTTLVATMLMRPWRTGWSVDRGVDFSLAARPLAVTVPTGETARAEPACFIDEDWARPAGATVVRTFVSTAAEAETAAEAPAGPVAETPGLRAWCSLSGKASGT